MIFISFRTTLYKAKTTTLTITTRKADERSLGLGSLKNLEQVLIPLSKDALNHCLAPYRDTIQNLCKSLALYRRNQKRSQIIGAPHERNPKRVLCVCVQKQLRTFLRETCFVAC